MPRRGRTIARICSLAALIAVAGAVWAGKGAILERVYLYRLRTGDQTARMGAIQELCSLGRVEALPEVLAAAAGDETLESVAQASIPAMGQPAKRQLAEALRSERPEVRKLAAGILLALSGKSEKPAPLLAWMLVEGQEEAPLLAVEEIGKRRNLPPEVIRAVRKVLSEAHQPDATHRRRDGVAWALKDVLADLGAAAAEMAPEFVDWALRSGGAEEALVRFGAPALPHLARALADQGKERRRRDAAWVLGKFGPAARPAVPALLELLYQEDIESSQAAAVALGEIGPVAVPGLTAALQSAAARVREMAASALAAMGTSAIEALPALERGLGDTDVKARLSAARALLEIGGGTLAVSADDIKTAVVGEVPVWGEHLPAAWEARWFWEELVIAVDPRLEACRPTLTRLFAGEEKARGGGAGFRAGKGLEASAGWKDLAGRLSCRLEEEPLDLEAARALWNIARPPWLIERLVEVLERCEYVSARWRALGILAEIGPPAKAAVPELLGLLREAKAHFVKSPVKAPDAKTADRPAAGVESEEAVSQGAWEEPPAIPLNGVLHALMSMGRDAALALPELRLLFQEREKGWTVPLAGTLWWLGETPESLIKPLEEVLSDRASWEDPPLFSGNGTDHGAFDSADGEAAAALLGSLGTAAKPALPALEAALSAPSSMVRFRCAWAIWKISGDAAKVAPVLVRLLEESAPWPVFSIRSSPLLIRALDDIDAMATTDCRLIARIGPPVVPHLLPLLEHRKHAVRAAAAKALGELREKPPEAVRALVAVLTDEHFRVAESAAAGLCRTSLTPEGIESLKPLLAHADVAVAGRAARVLAAQGEHGLAALVAFLEEAGPEPLEAVFLAFRSLDAAAVPAFSALVASGSSPRLRRGARALGAMGPTASGAAAVLETALDGPDRDALEAAAALWRASGRADRCVPVAAEAMESTEPRERLLAARLLAAIGPGARPAVPPLIAAATAGGPEVAAAAVEALAACGETGEEALGAMRKLCAHHDPAVRRASARALGALAEAARPAVPDLVRLLRDTDIEARRASALALGKAARGDAAAAGALVEAIRDADVGIRRIACRALEEMEIPTEQLAEALFEALVDEGSCLEAAQAIAGRPEVAARLFSRLLLALRLATTDPGCKEQILEAISKLPPAAAPAILEHFLPALGEQASLAFEAIGRLGEAGRPAVPELVKLLSDKGPFGLFTRMQAAKALGAVGAAAKEASAPLRALLDNRAEELDVVVAVRDALRRIESKPPGPAPTPRMASAVAVLDGWIYLAGGHGGEELSSVEAYAPLTGTWKKCASLGGPRVFGAAASAQGRLHVFGGLSGRHTLAAVEVYDAASDRWSAVTSLPTPRNRLAAAELGGKIYVVGGMEDGGNSGAVEIYDPAANSWSRGADLPTPRHGHCLVAREGKLIAIGGYAGEPTGAVEEYDPATDAWTALPPLRTARGFFGAASAGGKVYVYGGRLRDLPPTEILGGGTAAPFPVNNCRFASAAVGGRIYVLGGETEFGEKVSAKVWWYEGEGDRWLEK